MRYRRLGKTGMKVSVVGVGTWQFGGEWGKDFAQAEVDAILGRAAKLGVNLVDTAECYGDHLSEKLVGRAIESDRDRWIVATKFGHRFTGLFAREDIYDPDSVQRQLEDSLRALRTDRIDLYQFHSGSDDLFDTEGLWEMLAGQVKAGKIRHLGISITSKPKSTHQIDTATQVGAGAVQVVYNRLARGPEEHVFKVCMEQNIGVLARVPLASGFLTGKYDKKARFNANDVRATWKDPAEREALIDQVEQIRPEVPEGVPMAQWALAWCLRHPAVTCVIPGCKTVQQAESNVAAASLDMVRDDHPQAARV